MKHEATDHAIERRVQAHLQAQRIEAYLPCLLCQREEAARHLRELDAYLDELEFRYNNRENPYMFRDAMLKLLLAETLPYAKLIAD